ncbi:conserved protein of unknown function [Tepidanaerobacter acetatoxydans Re1]|jgi:hypothetical protein|uniref:Uncharacterized protein n=1 Tax=Tepidanaerobacter acetatoxydans (strain DSM 21804 / JCM 16047 / Re1) TaxID=1209989 RepID=U4QLB5_TEPAE|nr:conserved protein of unknown function [Tepidanaerobacter acetatoxydans Re1]
MEKPLCRLIGRRDIVERFRFFDSIDGEDERYYTADEFAEYFRQFIRNGIFNGGENLQVGTDERDMKIFIKPGYAWIEGYLYKIEKEPLVLEHSMADPELNRIDRVVIRLDKTLENRYVKAFILKGAPAETPQVPELTRDENIYEISLAQVEVIAGKSFIEAHQITDERLDNEVCGLVTHLFEQVNTTEIFNRFQSWLDSKTSEPDGDFYREWKDWFDEVQDTTNLVTKTQFDEHLSAWDAFKEEIKKKLDNYSLYAFDKDINGIFTVVEYRRKDDTLYMKSTVSDADEEGNYQINTWEFFDTDGITLLDTVIWNISYDKDGDIVSKVVS